MEQKQAETRTGAAPDGAATLQRPEFDPSEWKHFLEANTSKASSGNMTPTMQRRMVWTTIFPEMCRPGTFVRPIEIGMRELDSATERKVQIKIASMAPKPNPDDPPEGRDAQLVGAAYTIELAKSAIIEVNGVAVLPHEVDLLWEAIGMAGRQRCTDDFALHCCGFDQGAQEKSAALVRVG
jgi:hypothetical protein